VSPEIDHFVASEPLEDGLAERDAPMVECNGDLQAFDSIEFP
jgi:hypothetical protein